MWTPRKIGCLGASYGGFMTMYLQTLTDIFSAAVSHAGISNVTSYWGEGYWGYSYNSVAAAKSYPWNNPDLFTKQGALFNADKIHTLFFCFMEPKTQTFLLARAFSCSMP